MLIGNEDRIHRRVEGARVRWRRSTLCKTHDRLDGEKEEEIKKGHVVSCGGRAGLIMMPQIKIEDLDAPSESN